MILLQLFASFFQIGLFSFGGGYAMIPFIQHEVLRFGWVTPGEFVDIIAIAQIAPGPIAANAAAFVGYRAAGLTGGLVATLGVALPSLILILALSGFIFKYREHPLQRSIFHCVRPAVAGLIAAAAIRIAETALFRLPYGPGWFQNLVGQPGSVLEIRGVLLFILFVLLLAVFKVHPVTLVGIAMVAGILLYTVLPAVMPELRTTLAVPLPASRFVGPVSVFM
jgi:chromate transporter